MITFSKKQKQGWLEEYNTVVALYQVFVENRETLRTKQAEYRCDEVQALPIDFMMDVELKAKRALPLNLYCMFLSLAANGTPELLPEAARLLLGRTWKEYGLGIAGTYRVLYFKAKNAQIRSFIEESQNGIFGTDDNVVPDTATGATLDIDYSDGSGVNS